MRHLGVLISCWFLTITFVSAQSIHTFPEHSVLRSGRFVKICVSETGVYKLTYKNLQSMGIDPSKVCIYGYGGALLSQCFWQKDSKIDDLPIVPVYQGDDYILFYAQGPISWDWDKDEQYYKHTRNCYSDYGYYFVGESDSAERLVTPKPSLSLGAGESTTSFVRCLLHERELVNLIDEAGFDGGGREFFGETFTPRSKPLKVSFPYPGKIRYELAGYATNAPMTFTLNSTDIPISTTSSGDLYTKAKNAIGYLPSTSEVSISFGSSDGSAKGWLNYLECNASCPLTMTGSSMDMYFPVDGKTRMLSLSGVKVWDVSRRDSIYEVPLTNGTYTSTSNHLVAVDVSSHDFPTPDILDVVLNQDLHSLRDVEYLIVTPKVFLSQARELASLHRELRTVVVTDEAIYNEFSSGTPDATAIRWLAKMLYVRGGLKYLLLFGDGSFDNRQLLPHSGAHNLLTYQLNPVHSRNYLMETYSFPTDDYFGCLGDEVGLVGSSDVYYDNHGVMDIAVGRLPVSTSDEVTLMVDKIRHYLDDCTLGSWRQQLVFLADDGDQSLHVSVAEHSAELIRVSNPSYTINKLYLDAYHQTTNGAHEIYPQLSKQLHRFLSDGMLFFDYSGHGGFNNITSENLLSISDIRKMTNDHLGFWMFATCNFSRYDGEHRSGGELAVVNSMSGAIGTLSACRTVLADYNDRINVRICENLFGSEEISIGEAVRLAKNGCGVEYNHLAYVLLCDPALSLHRPTYDGIRSVFDVDTLKALSTHTLRGSVGDKTFTGKIRISCYDKMRSLTTNDNDERDESKKVRISYNDYVDLLWQIVVPVEDGQFEYTFQMPKDLYYSYGSGRFVFYAWDDTHCTDAIGYNEDVAIGGIDLTVPLDTIRPTITSYIDYEGFIDGSYTTEHPTFYATITDADGLNLFGTGIGHETTIMLDNDLQQLYYPSFVDCEDYHTVSIQQPFEHLSDGPHTVVLRTWDILNNSAINALHFIVHTGYVPEDVKTIVYPVPTSSTGSVTFQVSIMQTEYVKDLSVWVTDLSGKLVFRHTEPEGTTIVWSLEGRVPCGTYPYRVQYFVNGTKIVHSGKIIVNN